MRLILIILFCCVSVFSQTNTKTDKKSDTKIDEKEFTKSFAEIILKEANWVKVTSGSATDFYVDTTHLKREKNSVNFYIKSDKRGNLVYTTLSGDCQNDIYSMSITFQQDVDEELKMLPLPRDASGMSIAKDGTVMFEMLNYACTEGAKKKQE